MPIFEFDGTSYDVEDRYIDKFAAKYPDAVAYDSINGKRYRVKPGKWKKFAEKKATEEGLMSSLSKHVGPETIAQGRKMLGLDEPEPKKVESYASKAMNTDVEGLNADGSRDVKYRLPNGKIELDKGEHEVRNLLDESLRKDIQPKKEDDGKTFEDVWREAGGIEAPRPKAQQMNVDYAEGIGEGFVEGSKSLGYGLENAVAEGLRLVTGSLDDYDVARDIYRNLNKLGLTIDDLKDENGNYDVDKIIDSYSINADKYLESKKDNDLKWSKYLQNVKERYGEEEARKLYNDKWARLKFNNSILSPQSTNRNGVLDEIDENVNLFSANKAVKTRAANHLVNALKDAEKHGIWVEDALTNAWGKANKNKNLADRMGEHAREGLRNIKPTKGFGAWVGNLAPQMAGNVLALAAATNRFTRPLARPLGYANTSMLTASTAGSSMATARDYADRNKGVTEGEIWRAGLIDGGIEYLTEKIPMDMYLDNVLNKTTKQTGLRIAQNLNKETTEAEINKLLKKARNQLGGKILTTTGLKNYLKQVGTEGASEFMAGFLQTVSPIIYQNPEDYPTVMQALEDGWEGAKGGFFMGAFLGAGSSIIANRQQRARRKAQGYVVLADTDDGIVEIVNQNDDGTYQMLNNKGEEISLSAYDINDMTVIPFSAFDKGAVASSGATAKEEGSTAETPDEVRNVGMSMDETEQALLGTADGQNIKDALDRYVESGSTDVAQANAVLSGVSDDVRPIAEAYFMARVRTQAYADKKIDEVDAIVKSEEEKLAPYIYGGEEELQYDADGNIVRDEKGNAAEVTTPRMFAKMTIEDVEENQTTVYLHKYDPESNTLYYINEATGKVESMMRNDPRIVSLEEVDYDTYIEQVRADAQKKIADEANGMLNHSPKTNKVMKIGDVIHTAQGQMMVMSNADGQVQLLPAVMTKEGMVQAQQGEPVTVSMDDAMRMQDEYYEAKPVEAEAPVVESETQTSETEAPKAEAPKASPIPLVEDGKNKRVAYEQVPVERTVEEIVGQLDTQEEVDEFIEENIKEAEKLVKNATRPAPKMGTDIAKYKEEKAKWQEEQAKLADMQKRLDYWKSVKAEMARLQGVQEDVQSAKAEKDDLAPRSAMEYVASMINRIDPESYRRETGYGVKEQRKAGPIFLKKENGGMTIEQLAEYICEQPEAEEFGITPGMDAEVRNMILDVLAYGSPKAYIREAHKEQNRKDEEGAINAFDMMAQELGFASAEDMMAHDEVFLIEAIRAHYGLENSGFYDNLAEEYEKEDSYGQRNERQGDGTSAERPEEGDTTGTGQNDSEGGSVLSEEQSADSTRTGGDSTGQTSEPGGSAEGGVAGSSEGEAVQGEQGDVIQEPRFTEEVLENGDKRITNYNSRGEIEAVIVERDGRVVSVDNYDEGILFEHTEYDENGVSTAVTRYGKDGKVVAEHRFDSEEKKLNNLLDELKAKLGGLNKNNAPQYATALYELQKWSSLEEANEALKYLEKNYFEKGFTLGVLPFLDTAQELINKKESLRKRVKEWEKVLGVKVNIIESFREVKNKAAIEEIKSGSAVKGWYATKSNEVYIYMPHNTSESDIDMTMIHEVVAHKGLKELLGDKTFDRLCDKVWDAMPKQARDEYLNYVGGVEGDTEAQRAAADEYIAHLAEAIDRGELSEAEKTVWQSIVDFIKKLLFDKGMKITDEQIVALIKASYANMAQRSKAEDKQMFRKDTKDLLEYARMDVARHEAESLDVEGVRMKKVTDAKVIEELEKSEKRNPKLLEENEETRFSKSYKSKDGKETTYRQLSLFDTEGEAFNDGGRPASLQRKGDSRLTTLNSLRELEDGEICNVERKFSEKGGFDFTRGEKIASVQDVAYIFKNLEDEAIENTFVACVKGNNVTVLHIGMGAQTQSVADATAIIAGADRLNADKVYFVHNHPSGNLMCSREDINLYGAIKTALGDKLQDGIIINTRSGKYGVFNDAGVVSSGEERISPKKETPLKIYGFNKQAFYRDVVRMPSVSSVGIAEFISTQRLGSRNKINALLLDNNFGCVGNVFLSETDITSKNTHQVLTKLVSDAISMGARNIVIYGRAPFVSITNGKVNISPLGRMSEYVRGLSAGHIRLVDVIQLGEADYRDYRSAMDEGIRFSKAKNSNNLVAVHNISESNLRKVLEMGGLIMPSIAITDVNLGHSGYGEISLLFDKETINPSDSRNKVYGGDAWTPRFPQMVPKLNGEVVRSVRKKIEGLLDENLRAKYSLSAELHPSNIESTISNNGVEGYYGKEWMKIAYLLDNGKRFKIPMKMKDYGSMAETINKLAKDWGLSLSDIRNGGYEFYEKNPEFVSAVLDAKNEARLVSVSAEDRDKVRDLLRNRPMRFSAFDTYISQAIDMERDLNNGGLKQVVDGMALYEAINKRVKTDNAEYNKWVDDLFEGVVEKYGIRNNRDWYTPSGNSRPFEQLYDAPTPANILRYMLAQNDQGGSGGLWDSNIMGASAETYESIEEIREKGKKRLHKVSEDEYDEWATSVANRFSEICDEFMTASQKNDFGGIIDAKIAITNAVAKDKTVKGIYKTMKRQYANFTMEHAKRVEEIVKEIQDYAIGYFEAKPQRIVTLSEVRKAVVPSNVSSDIVEGLEKNGVEVATYRKGNEQSRNRIVKKESDGIRFRKANRNQAGFVSNAMVAVEGVKQDKATPEQWLKMIEKQGGLKAGEDKWLGLSDWLKSSDKKTLTKDEVLEFIGENMIQIEEVKYGEGMPKHAQEKLDELNEEFQALIWEGDEETGSVYTSDWVDYAWSAMVDRYGDDIDGAFEIEGNGTNAELVPMLDYNDEMVDQAKYFLEINDYTSKPINSTRLDYTTEGLENKREIALTVPTIESWNESDEIHFGDAGNGRAVAWVRFGETTDADGSKVLVIDEIQSKRHQEGREKGYRTEETTNKLIELKRNARASRIKLDNFTDSIISKYGVLSGEALPRQLAIARVLSKANEEDVTKYHELEVLADNADKLYTNYENEHGNISNRVPEAPFEKNWHELAMKRMLRLAAEEGFDKVAWTTGAQQAERYNIGDSVERIISEEYGMDEDGNRTTLVDIEPRGEMNNFRFEVNSEGIIIDGDREYEGKPLSDIVGKEIANKLMQGPTTISGQGLHIGGEGMKGFYDKMLPSFVQKYTKKWGAKVGEVTLPELEESAQKMWSVDVTDAMKESVEEQVMFSKKPRFMNGMNVDEVYDNLSGLPSWSNGAYNLVRALENYYDAEIGSASEGARNAMSKGLVPVPGGMYDGLDEEYHHIEFVGNDGETFVKSVPFVNATDVEDDWNIRFSKNDTDNILDYARRDVMIRDAEYVASLPKMYNLRGTYSQEIIMGMEDIEKMKGILPDALYNKLVSVYNEGVDTGVSFPYAGLVFVFMDKVANQREAELTWWHENTHCIYESLKIPNKESYGRAALDWISREHVDTYEVIMSVYKGDERLSEAVAMFVEHTIKKYGAEVFLKSNFGGNNKLSILAELIQKSFKYGTRQINREGKERDILRQTIYGGASNEGELSRVGKDTARPGIRQTENGGGTGGVQKEVLGEVLPGKKGFDAIAYAQQKVAEQEEEKTRMRKMVVELDKAEARREYEQTLESNAYRFQEAWQDSMLGLKALQDAVMKANGRTSIADWEDAYMAENQLSSINNAEQEAWRRIVFGEVLKEVKALMEKGLKREDISDYLMAKHGIERNTIFASRDAMAAATDEKGNFDAAVYQSEYAENRKRDYSGLTTLFDTDKEDVADAENKARIFVTDIEKRFTTDNLWKAINKATQSVLDKQLQSGLITKDMHDELSNRFSYYVPLRGFEETTSDEVYDYLSYSKGAFSSPIKNARGRSSVADDPIATLANMAESGIVHGNKNIMKQRFLLFVENNPSDLVSIDDVWVRYGGKDTEGNPIWLLQSPAYTADMTKEEMEQERERFEADMEAQRAMNPDMVKRGREAEDVPYRVVSSKNEQEHRVIVKRNGKTYVLTINGNPRAAQAINGLTNPETTDNALIKFGEHVNRYLSSVFTSRNPAFIFANLVRDGIYANQTIWAKESPAYAIKYNNNWAKAFSSIANLIKLYKENNLDMNNTEHKMFYDFIMNGGETGYTMLKSVDDYKDYISKELGTKRRNPLELIDRNLDTFNRWAEGISRYAAFKTSREMGRSIQRSIYDAKEISVNFNKKGAGARVSTKWDSKNVFSKNNLQFLNAWGSQLAREAFVFWNAGVQGLTNFGKIAVKNKGKFMTMAGGNFVIGMLMPMVNSLLAGLAGDDEDDYWNIPEYIRRNNLCLYVGGGYVKIPLPIELRAIYGLGELCAGHILGKSKDKGTDLARKVMEQVSQVMPIDLMEGGGGFMSFTPTFFKPIVEIVLNKDWTGMPIQKETDYNKNMPEWTKAYKGTNKALVSMTKALSDWTGGNDYKPGAVNISPAKIEHLIEGYLGGIGTLASQLYKTVSLPFDKDMQESWEFGRNAPIFNRFFTTGDGRTKEKGVTNEWFEHKEDMDIVKQQFNGFRKDMKTKDIVKYAEAKAELDKLKETDGFAQYLIWYSKDKELNNVREALKMDPGNKDLKARQLEIQMDMNNIFSKAE